MARPTKQMKTSLNLIGAAGEYYVCAELCNHGLLALLTPKNNPLFDVVATDEKGKKAVSVQVKTRSIHNKQGWKLGKEITNKQNNKSLFVVLVNLKENESPDYYIYKYDNLADKVGAVYEQYITTPKKDGNPRKPVSFRWYDEVSFTKSDLIAKNNWAPILKYLA